MTSSTLDRLVAFCERYGVRRHDTRLDADLVLLETTRDPAIRELLMQHVSTRVEKFAAFHRKYPFLIPAMASTDGLLLGQTLADRPVLIPVGSHLLIYGPTGAGKTSLLAHLRQQLPSGVHRITLDRKDDYERDLLDASVLSLNALPFAPLALPAYASPTEFINDTVRAFADPFWCKELQCGALTRALETLYTISSRPSLADLQRTLRSMKGEPARNVAERLESIRITNEAIFQSTANLWSVLHEQSLYYAVPGGLTSAHQFLFWHVVNQRWSYLRGTQQRDRVHTIVQVDEGDETFGDRTGDPSIPVQLLPRTREAGLFLWIGTPLWNLHPLVLANAQIQVLLQPAPNDLQRIARAWNLNADQVSYLTTMQRGQALARVRDEHPFLLTLTPTLVRKDIRDSEREQAREHSRRFAQQQTPTQVVQPAGTPQASTRTTASNTLPSSELTAARGAMVLQPVPLAPSPSPTFVASVEHTETFKTAILTAAQVSFLTFVAKRGIALVTETYYAQALKPMQGDRIKRKLVSLGLLQATRITVGSGRGKQATALQATAVAYNMLFLAKPSLGRGSGPQHAYLLRELRDRIPHCTIEVAGADAAIAYNEQEHAPLLRALRTTAQQEIALNTGDTLAIEVELRPAKTMARNIARNTDRGFTLTVIALLHDPRDIASNVIAFNVFRFLERLRVKR